MSENERRKFDGFSEKQIEEITRIVLRVVETEREETAKLAAKHAIDNIAAEVGKGMLRRLFVLVGLAIIALLYWLGQHGVPLKP